MNNLSWILYAADAFNNLGHLFVFFGAVGSIVCLASIIAGACSMGQNREYNTREALDRDYANGKAWFRRGCRWIALPLTLLVVSMLIPSKQTIYLIAASEMGEEAMATPEFAKIRQVVNNYLDDALSDETKGDK